MNGRKCPQCESNTVRKGNSFFPFCSNRCKMIDLGNWLSESYRFEGEENIDDVTIYEEENSPGASS